MRKIFTFLCAALMSVGMWALTPKSGDTWDETTKTLTVNSNPEDYAYWGESDIENLVISDAVTSIGVSAFEECSALTSVTIGNSVTSIGTSAFSSCYLLTSVEIPNSVEEIGVQAFASCSELTSVTIGNGVTSIGDYAFVDCSGLETVTINAESLESYGTDAFEGTAEDLTIYVPAGSVDTYKAGWAAYEDKIVAAPEPEPAGQVITWDSDDLNTFPEYLLQGESKTIKGITVTVNQGNLAAGNSQVGFNPNGSNDAFTFSTELGNFTKIECTTLMVTGSLGEGWESATWTGNANSVNFGNAGSFLVVSSITFTIEPASTPEPEPEPAGEVTVVFAANNNTVERTVTLPHNFSCSYENKDGELDAIIKELYEISAGHCSDDNYPVASGNEAVTAGSNGFDNYITISAAFEGTATVSGWYWNSDAYDGDGDWMDYSLTISIKGDATAIDEVQSDKVQSTKVLRNGMLLIEKNGKIYNVMGAEVK